MHILFLTDNFPPEGNAPATRTFEHAREWVKLGHRVTVITGAPNFPEGKVFPGYKNKWYTKEVINEIEVRRVKTYITSNEGFSKRIFDYLSFMVSGFIASLFVTKPDVVIGTSPQFFTACAAWLTSVFKRKPFVFELRDIWPASITAVGAMNKTLAIRFLEKIELFLYRRADKIICVTHKFKQELGTRGIELSKVEVVLNGVDLAKYKPQEKNIELLEKYNLQGKFVAGYIGTHGMAHALETIVAAAELLKEHKNIIFLFAGGGAGSAQVEKLVKSKNLENVRILGRQNKNLMPAIWSLCDLSIVHLKNVPLFESVIPSKIFESMGMGLPILIGVPKGESTDIISKNGAGLIIPPEDEKSMAEAINLLSNDLEKLKIFKKNSRKAAKQFDRNHFAKLMSDILSSLK